MTSTTICSFYSCYAAPRGTEINFGTLAIGKSRQVTFRLSNLSDHSVMRFQWPTTPPLTLMPSVGHLRPKTSKTIIVTFKATKPQSLKADRVQGKLWKITFSKHHSQVLDWDDRRKSVLWVPVPQPQPPAPPPPPTGGLDNSSTNSISTTTSKLQTSPLKKRVVETEREPAHQVLDDSHRDLELLVTGISDFCKYECPIHEVKFRDTLMYQTRVYTFSLKNSGKIVLDYRWSILTQEQSRAPSSHGDERERESMDSEPKDLTPSPFSVSPESGSIFPDKETDITVRFSPMSVTEIRSLLHC